ncbi:acriflavin resistance protein [candidate division TA06 bacterium SM1_40]|uniref:Acriflavin resistance protein n=2 Tax=Bacteria division TA06 TaxID=1156500 RepID=A0A0S8JRP0_UNCT6|nr:MAG: acriflavin resistance protein [candidate division TA06 bacterium SM23_40]KPL11429.1 MAG: acriflavin resistance protein [candidate division TA06 bacterium SM1_40]
MRPFFKFFAERHLLAMLITLMIVMLGVNSYLRIRREMFPKVDLGFVFISTRYPGASPEDVELNVTNKIEAELEAVTGIDRITSYSMENVSVITIVLDPDERDQDKIKSEIREAVARVTDLPDDVTESPYVIEITSAIFPVIEVGLMGDIPYEELREIARLFEKKLETLDGVSHVDKYGYLAREVEIEVYPEAIRKYQIPLREIIAAIQARNIRATGGSFESYTSEKNVVTLAQFEDPLEVGDVIVRSTFEGPQIRVKDLAIVKSEFEDARILSRVNGKSAISFIVSKKETADIIRTVDAVKQLVEQERPHFPEGVDISYSDDFSRYVRNRFQVVRVNGAIGLALVIIILSVFLNPRSAFWVAMGIPISLLGVIFCLPFFDVYLDSISLAAMIMVIGIIVDDGIIIAENIQRHRETGEGALNAAVNGIHGVFAPVVTTVLTTILAFVPFFLLGGIMGKFVYVIPLVITLALLISLIEATVALPAHLTMGLPQTPGEKGKVVTRQWFNLLRSPFERFLRRFLRFRYAFVVFSFALLFVALWYAGSYMKFVLFPSSMAEQFYILAELPSGTSLQATSDKLKEIERLVADLPDDELDSYVTRLGTLEDFAPGENENWAIIGVSLTPFATRDRTADDIVDDLRQKTDRLEGYDAITYSIEAGGPPVGRPITLRVVGSDDTLRTALADSIVAFLGTLEGVKGIDRNDKYGKDQVEIDIDHDKLARRGLTVADIARTVRTAYDGERVTSVRYGEETVEFRVRLQAAARERPEDLGELLIPNQLGRLIRLREVAQLSTGPGPSNFFHHDGERAITVTADVTKGSTTPVEATDAVFGHFNLDRDWPGMRFVVGGEVEETEETLINLARAFIIAVVGIYFLLILLFNSLTQPLLVMVAIPFGIMGVIVAFAVHAEDFGFVAAVGVIGLAGVLVNDSLVLVNHINKLRVKCPDESVSSLVAQGTTHRLRAVLLTTLTTVGGLLPLAYGFGGTDPYMAPMALAIAWGLAFGTPLTLFLVPCLYVIRHDMGRGLLAVRRALARGGARPETQ